MSCPRCHGFMVHDLSCDLEETQGMWVQTIRCMNCGHVTDPTIEKHRAQAAQARVLAQATPKMELGQVQESKLREPAANI